MPTEAAEAPTVFMLPALGGAARGFDPLVERLVDRFECVGIDLPGFGGAPVSAGTTVEEMVAFVERRIRSHGSSRWLLLGHSMGGKIATIVASRVLSGEAHLFGLAGVVLLAGSPPAPEPMGADRRAEMVAWSADGALDEAAARAFVDGNTGSPLSPEADAAAMGFVMQSSPEAWTAWLERGSREDWSDRVGRLDIPALLVAGGADGDLGEDAQRDLNGRVYPRSSLVVLEGAGHFLPAERSAEVAELITRFWDGEAGIGPAVPRDVATTIASARTSARTRGILARRALADDPDYRPHTLDPGQLDALRKVADRVVPQDGPPIDLAARVDAQLAAGEGDGWRNAASPPDPEAYRRCLDALGRAGFRDAASDEQDAVLARLDDGGFEPGGDIAAAELAAWWDDVRVDLVRQWLAHPVNLARVGWDAYANGGDGLRKQGFQLLGAGQREAWEPLEAMATTAVEETR